VRPYVAVAAARLREQLQYRTAAWAGVFTQVVFGAIFLVGLRAFRDASAVAAAAPMRWPDVVAYVWLGQAFLALLPWNVDREIAAQVRTGTIVYELARPADLYALWYARTFGWRVAATVLRCVPLLLLVGPALHPIAPEWALAAPPSPAAAVVFVAAECVAVCLGVALTMLMHVLAVWTHTVDGIARTFPALVLVASGMVIPLPLFPDRIARLLALSPFGGLCDVPFRIYSGHLPLDAAAASIARSAAWTLAIVVGSRLLLGRALRQAVVNGG
jgi:ABC-2 type transport system permease protein